MGLILLNPQRYATSCLDGFRTWRRFVLPSLFPFFFLTKILCNFKLIDKISKFFAPFVGKLFHVKPIISFIMISSFLSGYPIGASLLSELKTKGAISSKDVQNSCILCSTSGVSFCIGVIGGMMLESVALGVTIYLSHICSALLFGIIFRNKEYVPNSNFYTPLKKSDNILSEAIHSSVISILIVGGYIAIFYVLLTLINDLGGFYLFEKYFSKVGLAISKGFFEATCGIYEISKIINKKLAAAISTFIITFGGLSINFQQLALLQNCGVKTGIFLRNKFIQSIFSLGLFFIFSLII